MTHAALWLYAIAGTLYWTLSAVTGNALVVRLGAGLMGALLMLAPVLLVLLALRLGLIALLARIYLPDTR